MILGKNIRLRLPETDKDHELLVMWRNDPDMKLMFYDDEPVSMDSHLTWWKRVSVDPTQRNYMIDAVDRDNFMPIGMTALVNLDWRNRTAEYGRLKIDARYQKRGYAFDAEMTLMRYAFDSLNLQRVWLHALDYNVAVIQLHLKTGFTQEGCLRQHIYKNGRYYDVMTMGLLADEFRKLFPAAVQS